MCHAHSSPKLFYWTCSYWNFSRKLLFCISIADYHASQPRVHLKMYALGKLELVFIETICWDTSNSLIPLVNHNPAIFSFPQALKNVKSPTRQRNLKALIIPTCSICLTMTLTLISETHLSSKQLTNTSQFVVMLFKWFNRTKMSQN